MLTSKEEVAKYLEKQILKIVYDRQECRKLYVLCNEKYNLPVGKVSDIVTMRVNIYEANEFIMFCILDCLGELFGKELAISKYFTELEIANYSKARYEEEKIKFPLRFKMIQISDDQWIGKITAKELMAFRNEQLINYNSNTQRTMKQIIKGENEYYKITLNDQAVREIEASLSKKVFIPNTITLNIPIDEHDFYYDENANELVIESLDHFDITDGYHRYISLCNQYDSSPQFDYPMELRIVNFYEDKAKQFIFQEDQKTKMKKMDSDSFNMNNAANIITKRINESPDCLLRGEIRNEGGLIDFGELAAYIGYLFLKDVKAKEEKVKIIQLTKELVEDFNMLAEYNEKYVTVPYNFRTFLSVIVGFYKYHGKDKTDMCEVIDRTVNIMQDVKDRKLTNKYPRKTLIKLVEGIMEGED